LAGAWYGTPPGEAQEVTISTKLFVGNLDFDTTRAELERLFSSVGPVTEVFLPTDRATGRPRGFAFVEFTDASAAAAATQRFDGFELNGRSLRVNEAQERRPRPPSSAPAFVDDWQPPEAMSFHRGAKPKGSRRNLRRKKRSL